MVDYHITVWRIFLSEKHKLDTEFSFQFIGEFFLVGGQVSVFGEYGAELSPALTVECR